MYEDELGKNITQFEKDLAILGSDITSLPLVRRYEETLGLKRTTELINQLTILSG